MESAFAQTLIVGAIVLGAAGYLARRAWRSFGGAKRAAGTDASCGTDGGCGCTSGSRADSDSLTPSTRV